MGRCSRCSTRPTAPSSPTSPSPAHAELDAAVRAAAAAFPAWSARTIKDRVQVFFRYRTLLERDAAELAELIVEEHGKTRSEAEAEIAKAIELTEFACSLPQIVTGEVLEVSRGVECRIERHPLGVVASIVPFNFPSMVPNWTIPNAIALGNCLVLKPSELVPLSAGRLAELLAEAGLPAGVFSLVHGGREVVEAICDHPGIAAVSFVGSTRVAQLVYRRGTASLKRVLALGGAKNHLLVLPDADLEMTSSNVVASMSGCTGQRCMAASVMVAVGSTDHIVKRLVEHARSVVPGKNLGPVISREAKERIERYVDGGGAGRRHRPARRPQHRRARPGGRLLRRPDGPRPRPPRHGDREGGGLRSRVGDRPGQGRGPGPRHRERLPLRQRRLGLHRERRPGALRHRARQRRHGRRQRRVCPVPREPFSFGGWNDSKFGVGDITGHGSIEFWTKAKKTTTKWNREAGVNWMS